MTNELALKNQQKWIVLLVPTVVLCKQQHEFLLSNGTSSVGVFHGELRVDMWSIFRWKEEYSKHKIFVMTAQVFLDNLRQSVISMSQIALIIFDECHHAKKGHPYNRIMIEFFSESVQKPKILGLTASPVSTGVSKSDSKAKQTQLLQTLSQNLNAKIIVPSANLLKESLGSQPQELIENYPLPPPCYSAALQFVTDRCPILEENNKVLFSKMSHESVIESLGTWSAAHLTQQLLYDLQRLPYGPMIFGYHEHLRYLQHFLQSWSHLLQHSTPLSAHDLSPQAIHLIQILSNHIKNSPKDSQVCVIIFARTRYTACYLAKLLQSMSSAPQPSSISTPCFHCRQSSRVLESAKRVFYEHRIQTDYLVSKNSVSRGYEMKSNSATLEKFHKGITQILVATSVAEEGLDVQPCQLVIRYQEVQTVSSYVQSRGRARHMSSKYIVLESQTAEDAPLSFRAVRQCEKMMRSQLSNPMASPSRLPRSLGEEEMYVVPSTGARVSLNSSITLIYRYCDSLLSRDQYISVSPTYLLVTEDEDTSSYAFDLYLPPQCPLPNGLIHGNTLPGKLQAKQAVSLDACRVLHQAGLLDDHLLPIRLPKLSKSKSPNEAQELQVLPPDADSLPTEFDLPIISWEDIQQRDGQTLHIYSLSGDSLPLPFQIFTVIKISASELAIKIPPWTESSQELSLRYLESRVFSFAQLISLQQRFGQLMASFVPSSSSLSSSASRLSRLFQAHSTSLSPIMITQITQQLTTSYPSFPTLAAVATLPIPTLVQTIERYLRLTLCQSALGLRFLNQSLLDQALTAPSMQLTYSSPSSSELLPYDYNRLETLGDALLKLTISMDLFHRFPHSTEGELSVQRNQLVSNATLRRQGLSLQTHQFIQTKLTPLRSFVPLGYLTTEAQDERQQQRQEELQFIQNSNKMISDVLEALLGAVYLDSGRNLRKTWVHGCLPLKILQRAPYPQSASDHSLSPTVLRESHTVEEILAYQFNSPTLLLEALTHPSYSASAPSSSCSPPCPCPSYQRLEFLGDALLGFLMTEFLFDWTPRLSSGDITQWKAYFISNEFLASVTVHSNLISSLRYYSTQLQHALQEYTQLLDTSPTAQREEQDQDDMLSPPPLPVTNSRGLYSQTNAPKVLADVLEAVLGAVFLDSGDRALEECRRIISTLILEPFVIPALVGGAGMGMGTGEGTSSREEGWGSGSDSSLVWGLQKHPVSVLQEIVSMFGCRHGMVTSFSCSSSGSGYCCQVSCHGQMLSEGTGANKRTARLAAALQLPPQQLISHLRVSCTCSGTVSSTG
jgi:dsRNA-specific ribonuclease